MTINNKGSEDAGAVPATSTIIWELDMYRVEYNGGGCYVCIVNPADLEDKLKELGSRVRRVDEAKEYYSRIMTGVK